MKLGIFGMPLHPPGRPRAETYEEDADRVIYADELGFDEAWIGEHMTCTTETIAAPMMFLATLIHRTRQIKLATGVVALPNHHPAIVAAEVAQFDHLCRGRMLFGIGPGGLASDMELFDVLDNEVRTERMMDSIDIILKLWNQEPPYDVKGKYWNVTLKNTVIPELGVGYIPKPFQLPHPPIMMTAMSPFSGSVKTAAERGWGPMSANFCPEYVIASHWKKYQEGCEAAGRKGTGEDWRVARNVVIARSDEEAFERVMDQNGSNYYFFKYLWEVLSRANYTAVMKDNPKQPDSEVTVQQLVDSMVIYGSPKTVTEKLLALRERTGPFGGLLMAAMDGQGVNRSREWESMRLLATEVMPEVRRALGR